MVARVVAQGAERADLGHGTSRSGTTADGSGTVASYDSRRSDASDRATFGPRRGVLAATSPVPTSPWGARAPSPAHATQLPGRPPRAADRGRPRPLWSAPWDPPRCRPRPPAGRRWRRGSCSAATPGSGPGWRSPSTSRTTARRSRRAAARRRHPEPDAVRPCAATCRPRPDKTFCCTPSRRPSARDLAGPASSRATRPSPRPRPRSRIHDATQLVVAVVAEHPERIVGSLHLPAQPEPGRAAAS